MIKKYIAVIEWTQRGNIIDIQRDGCLWQLCNWLSFYATLCSTHIYAVFVWKFSLFICSSESRINCIKVCILRIFRHLTIPPIYQWRNELRIFFFSHSTEKCKLMKKFSGFLDWQCRMYGKQLVDIFSLKNMHEMILPFFEYFYDQSHAMPFTWFDLRNNK